MWTLVHALHANQHFSGLPHDPAVSLIVTNLKEGERYREFYLLRGGGGRGTSEAVFLPNTLA